jgi:membrane protein required for beta-lactamase induction
MLSLESDPQVQVDALSHRALLSGVYWLAGVGSVWAILYANRALQTIHASPVPLEGASRARFARLLGTLGLALWLPVVGICIVMAFARR